eukprot:CAMPEP_0196580612 /NCGR_PEP_ID=MMETSP1081-20130531/29614_1 /TAXON_ID=36882 /ORGANISM="Pyramimonas amylifera, Strain CCMP720" /LENGTH=110 /DNA_ID=CAMNT_0041900525 /DNA_START=65 /DNA_END=397 /DNA_ORIENTATION=-
MSARQLKIKTGILTRTKKELIMYEKELEKEKVKTEKLRAEGAEAATVKQQENVLAEAEMMIPDTRQRLEKALQDMQAFLVENESDAEIAETEDMTKAKEIMEEVTTLISA